MKKLKRIMKDLESVMAAASLAEEGEAAAARELLKEDRRVLLAIRENQLDRRTFIYAINTCKRNGAGLDILYISSSESLHPLLSEALSNIQREGIDFRLVRKHGCLKQQIIEYTNATREIIFAVTDSSHNLDVDCASKGRRLSDAWQNLKCPLVVVADSA
jgi:hypothetical protein